ncbi:MAG: thermonuclease family protein [Pseudomonadota bacterium]
MSPKPSRPQFRRARNVGSRRRIGLFNWWLLWRVPALALIVMLAWWFIVRPIAQEQSWVQVNESFALCGEAPRQDGCVIDGDTLFLGEGAQQRRIRLTGFDAPELDGECEQERALAIAARERLHQWLAVGPFEWNGADSPPRDTYGRELRAARRAQPDGSTETLADVMIASGLASQRGWGEPPRDWCTE